MNAMKRYRWPATLLALLSAGVCALLLVKNKAPKGFLLWIPKLFAGAVAPFFAVAGLLSAFLGALSGSWLAVIAGLFSVRTGWKYLVNVVIQPQMNMYPRFDHAFGADWEERLARKTTPQTRDRMQQWRWNWLHPSEPHVRWLRDVPFWTDPQSGHTLLCDLWLPPEPGRGHALQTGLGMLYFHGSAWSLGNKDMGTRAFFRHLAAQGHVIMDAQYRLVPEVDIFGMLGDVKHALAWFKENAEKFGVDPTQVVISGASAGGQLAQLAAYAPQHPQLTPPELLDRDLSVRGVVSYYGPCDLRAVYYHTNQQNTSYAQLADRADGIKFGQMSLAGRLEPLLGGTPQEAPDAYALASPITHAGPGCPPTFLVQGADDLIVPLDATYHLYDKLVAANVPVVNLVLPQVEHGFDLLLPQVSPAAQSAQYELDRFLALLLA